MAVFIPAEILKSKYRVFGHFYSIRIPARKPIPCRSVLELVSEEVVPQSLDAISQRKPDAVFVMMNPGSSRPLVDVDTHATAKSIHAMPISLVPTKPDTTQYQVMRLMFYCKWRHVRVLNLSDLRCSKSGEFFKEFKRIEEEASFDAHSIFSTHRSNELTSKLTQYKSIPVIRAWGVSAELDPLIHRCAARIAKHKSVRGLIKAGTADKYLHPLPSLQRQKLLWVDRMVKQLSGAGC
ncbi:MAG: DUF1643 domain-containing protein [Planctomycetes bacterium]|nr:DUF1643 domain-containing protein [Planctomycetota bacterium]